MHSENLNMLAYLERLPFKNKLIKGSYKLQEIDLDPPLTGQNRLEMSIVNQQPVSPPSYSWGDRIASPFPDFGTSLSQLPGLWIQKFQMYT